MLMLHIYSNNKSTIPILNYAALSLCRRGCLFYIMQTMLFIYINVQMRLLSYMFF
jgi:hypothetical protein